MNDSQQIGPALTWEQLADLYDAERSGGRPARTLPMDTVFAWAERQVRFKVLGEEGTIHVVLPNQEA